MRTRPLEKSVERIRAKLAKNYPGLQFDVEVASPKEATIYFQERDSEDWYDVIHSISGLAVDILVDYGHWIHVQPRFKEPATP